MIIESIIVLAGLGLIFGIFLAFFSKKFHVEHNPKIDKVLKILPGVNCGACGYAGCKAYAEAVATNKDVPVDLCVPGKKEVAEKIAKIVGREAKGRKLQLVAKLKCAGSKEHITSKFKYDGIKTCKAANVVLGGFNSCSYGCIGYGDCVKVCKFDALKMDASGLPVVDKKKCTACAACVKECPKNLFRLVPKYKKVHVLCNSKDNGKHVVKVCKVGCIGCGACERACNFDAIHVKDNLADIDYSKCTMCGKCVSVCPRKIIIDERKTTENKATKTT
jgi:Na+-translocating ferredoxin:NAD+ oxidoreductase RNF subunit RnfB